MLSLLLLSSLALSDAQAGDYSVTWGPEPVKYHLETLVATPRGYTYWAVNNTELRALQMGMAVDVTCTARPVGKLSEVSCVVDEAAFQAQPMATDEDKAPIVEKEYAEVLKGSTVVIMIGPDGRIRNLDLEGPEKDWWREARIQELLRQLMRRAFTPFDVQTPKNGEATTKSWKHKGFPLVFELMSRTGTTGGVALKWTITDDVAGRKMMVAEGRGNVASNAEASGNGSVVPSVNMTGAMQVLLDPGASQLAYGEFMTSGLMSAQNVNAVGDLGYLDYAGFAARINDDGTIESLEGPKAQ